MDGVGAPVGLGVGVGVRVTVVTRGDHASLQSEEAEGRSYSTLSTVREIETQTEVPVSPLLSPSLEG